MLRSKPTPTFVNALRFLPLAAVLIAVCIPANAQNPQFDSRFVMAQRDASANELDRAFDAYISVKNHSGTNGPVQADALLRAALMAWNALHEDNYRVTLRQIGGTEKEDDLAGLGYKADGVLNQLLSTYGDSPAADQARLHIYGPARNLDLRRAVENEIDLRNSRYISYKLLNSLVAVTGSLPGFSYWFALLVIALAVKAITFPFYLKSYASQREMRRIQPIIADLQKRMKGSKDLNQKLMETYKEHGVNPMAGCIPMLIPLPLTWWVYSVIRLYQFHFANGTFLWIGSALSHHIPNVLATNLATFDYPILILYAASNYLMMALNPMMDPQQQAQQKPMNIMMTAVLFYMFMMYRWSSAFILYWLVLNALTAVQQYIYVYRPARGSAPAGVPTVIAGPTTSGGAGAGNGKNGGRGGSGKEGGNAPVAVRSVASTELRARPRKKRQL